MPKIDLKDRRILAELDMNARMPITQLAKKVSLSRQVVEYRLQRMFKEKIVYGAIGIFDTVVVGQNWYRIAFRLLNVEKEDKDSFIAYLKEHKHVLWLGETGGNWDLVMNFICKDNFEFNEIFEQIIADHGAKILDYEVLIYINVYDLQRQYILPECKDERKVLFHEMKYNTAVQMDALDKKIALALTKDAFMTNVGLGKALGVSANTIKNRIDAMKKNKLLLGFRLMINPGVFGYKSNMLFLEINRLDLQREKELYAYLKTIPNISFLVKHMGRWRIGMEIETQTSEEFQEIFVLIRGKFNDIITDFETFPIFMDHALNYFPKGCLEED
jgi:DNA-binding Lrp family transcriptional regulator